VTPEDGSGDAFLHASAVRDAGHEALVAGQPLVCDIAPGQKGPQVALIHSIAEPPSLPARGRPRPAASPPPAPPRAPPAQEGRTRELEGTVKFFSPEKRFGFITPDKGAKDIFVHESALRRSGLEALQPRVRVRVRVKETDRGLEAEHVQFL
jgi:CspA family cold shock protein